MDSAPGGGTELKVYWTKGKGAAKIKWGTPGDFNRCVRHLAKYLADPEGYCNVLHRLALGVAPGQEGRGGGKRHG